MKHNLKVSELELLPINLQLFAEGDDSSDTDMNVVDSDDGDVDPMDEDDVGLDDDSDDSLDDSDEGEEDPDFADPDKNQTKEENAQFKKMRLKAEEAAKKKLQKEREELQREKESIKIFKQQMAERDIEQKVLASITQDKVWEKADEEGITEKAARKMLELEARQAIELEKQKARNYYQNIEKQKNALRKEEFFALLEPEIDKIIDANPGVNIDVVYHHLVGQRYKELSAKKQKSNQKTNTADTQDKMRRRNVGTSGNARASSSTTMSNFGREAAMAMGLDPREVAKINATRRKNYKV